MELYMCGEVANTFLSKLKGHPKIGPLFAGMTCSDDCYVCMFSHIMNALMNCEISEDMKQRIMDAHSFLNITKEGFDTWLECLEETLDSVGVQGHTKASFLDRARRCQSLVVREEMVGMMDERIRHLEALVMKAKALNLAAT